MEESSQNYVRNYETYWVPSALVVHIHTVAGVKSLGRPGFCAVEPYDPPYIKHSGENKNTRNELTCKY